MSKYDNWDDMEEFDEDEFFADFSKMTGGDLDEDPSEKKGIKSFFKNVVKSLGRGTAKIGKVFMPEAIETISSFGDIGRETKDSLADVKTKMMKELRQNFKTSGDVKLSKAVSDKLTEAKKDVFERVTTGNFIKAEKGIDFNFDDEDEEEPSDDEYGEDEDAEQEYYEEKEEFLSEFGELDKFKATAMPKDSEKQQIKQNLVIKKINTGNNRVAKATLSAAEASISAQEQLFSKAQLMAESRHNQKMAYIRNIAKNVYASSASSAIYAKMFLEYGKKHLAMVADSLALAKEMHQYQTKLYAKTLGETDAFGNPTGPTAASIFGGGGFLASDYFEAVKNNITNILRDSMIGQLYEQGVMMNEMMEGMGGKKKGAIGNILSMINPAELLIRGMFGEQAKLGFETLNKFGKAIPAMLNQKLIKMSGKGGFLGLIGEMLGIRDTSGSLDFSAKASQRNLKDPAIWDQKSWITLNEIIPGYLSTMTAALTGKEQTYYDHETMEFRTVSSMEKRYKQQMEYAYYSDNDVQDRMMEISSKAIQEGEKTGLTPAQIKDGIDKIYKKLVDIGLEFEPARVNIDSDYAELLTEYVKGTEAEKTYLLKQFVKAFNEMTGQQKAQFNLGIAVTQTEVNQARKYYVDKAYDSGNVMYVKKFEDANHTKTLENLIRDTENKLKGKKDDDMSVIPLKKKLAQLKRELYNEKMGSVDLLNKEDTNIEDEELRTMGATMNSSTGILKKMLKMMSVGLPVFVIKKNKKTLEEYKMLRTFFNQTEKDIKDKKMIEELQNEELGQSALDTSQRLSQEIRAKYYSKLNTGFGKTKLGYDLNRLAGGFTTFGMQTLGKIFGYDFSDANFMPEDLTIQQINEMQGKFGPEFGESLNNASTIEASYEEISNLEAVFPFGSAEDKKLDNIKKRLKEVKIDNTQLLHDAYLNRADPKYAEKVEEELAKIKEEIIDLMAERDYLDKKKGKKKKASRKDKDQYILGINSMNEISWKNEEMDKKLANTRNEKGENFLKSISKAELKSMVATILNKPLDDPKIKTMKVDEMRSIVSKYFNKEVSKNADLIKEFGDDQKKLSEYMSKQEMDYSGHGLTDADLKKLAIAEFQRRMRANFYEDLKIAEAYTTFTDDEIKNINYAESVIITMREAYPKNWWTKLDRDEILNYLYPGMETDIANMSAAKKNEMLKQYARERIDPDIAEEVEYAKYQEYVAKQEAKEEKARQKEKEKDDKYWKEYEEKRQKLWLEDIKRREKHEEKAAKAKKGTKVEKYKTTEAFKKMFGDVKKKNGVIAKTTKKIMDMGYDQVTYIKKTERTDTIGSVLILANLRDAKYITKYISDAWAFGSELDMFACNAVYISPNYIDMLDTEYSPLNNAPNFSEDELEMLVSENRIKVFTDPDLLLNWTEKNDPMNIQESIEMVQKQEKKYSIREQKRIDAIRKAKSNLKERAIKRLEDKQRGPYLSDEVINKEMDKIKEEDKEKSKIKKKTKSTSLYDILLATLSIKNTLKKGFSRMTNLREEAFDDTKTGSLESLVDDIETAKSNINMGVSAQKDGPEKFINKELTLLEEMNLSLKLLASSKVIEDADGDEDGSFLEWLKGAPGKAYNKVKKLFSSTTSKKSKETKKKRGRKKKEEEKGLIATILGDLSDLMGEIFGPAWEKVKEFGGGIKDFLFGEGSVTDKIGKGAGWAKDRLFDLLGLGKDVAGGVIETGATVAGKVVEGGLDVAGKAVDKGKDILFGIKEGIIKWKNDKLDPKLAELGEKYGKKFLHKLKKEELKVIVASILKLDPDDPQIKSMKVAELREIAENYYEENILPKIEEFKSKGSDMLSNVKEKGKGLIGKLGEMLSGALGLGADGLSTILGTVSGALSDLNLGEAISNFRPFGGGGGNPVYTRAILQNVIAMRLILAREFGSVDMNKIDKSIDQLDTSASKSNGKSGFFKTMGKIFGNAFTAIVGAPGKAIDLWKNAREARKRGEISETEQKIRDKIDEIGHDLQVKGKKAKDLVVHKAGELKDKASKKAEELDIKGKAKKAKDLVVDKAGELKDKASKKAEELDIKGKAKKAKDKVKELVVTGKDKISELATNSMERFKDLNKFLGDLGKKFGRIFVYGLSPRQMRIATAMILDMDPTDKALDEYPINLMREIVLNHYVNNILPNIKEKKIKLSEEDKKELAQADKDTTKYKLTADGTDVEAKKKRGRPKKGTGSADLADGFTASEHGDHIREGSRADTLLDKAKAKAEKLQEKTAQLLETIAVNTGLSTKLQKEGNKINKDNGEKMDENNNDEDGDGGILGFLGSFAGDFIMDRFFGGGKNKSKRRRSRPRTKNKSKWRKKIKSIFNGKNKKKKGIFKKIGDIFKKSKKGKVGKILKKGGKFLNKAGKIGAIASLGVAGYNILTGNGSVEDVMEVAESGKDVALSAGKQAAKQAAKQAGKQAAKNKAKKTLLSRLLKQGGKQAAKSGGSSLTKSLGKAAVTVGKTAGKSALNIAKAGGKVALGLSDKIAKLIGFLLGKFFQNPAIAKKVGNKAVSSITKAIIASVKKIAGPTLAKLGAKIGALMGMIGSGLGAIPGVVWKIADATLGFFNGMKNANKFWGVGSTTKLTPGMKIATGLVGAIDGLCWGVLSITGAFLGGNMNGGDGLGYWIQLVYKLLGGNTDAVNKAQNFAKLRAEVYGIPDVQAFISFEKAWVRYAGRLAKMLGFGKDKKAYEYWHEKRYKPIRDIEDQIIDQFGGDAKMLQGLDDDDKYGEIRTKYRKAFLDAANKYVKDNRIGWLVAGVDSKTIETMEKQNKLHEEYEKKNPNAGQEGEEGDKQDDPGSNSDAEKLINSAGKDDATSIANSMNPNAAGNIKTHNTSVTENDINQQNGYDLPKATVDYDKTTSENQNKPGKNNNTKRDVGNGTQAKPLPESLKTAAGRIELILRNEGGYCNYKEDKGGPTNYGIAWNYNKAELAKYGITNPEQMKTLDKNIAIQIYYNKYYKPSGADSITDPVLAVHVFDVAVNSGVGRAKEFLAEAKKHPNPRDYFIQRRYNYYRALVKKNPQYQRFERGWLNRIKHTNDALGYVYSEGSYVDSTSTSTSTSSSASYTPGTNPNTHANGNVSNVELNNNSGLTSSDTNAVEALNKMANSTSGPTPSDVASGTGDSSLMGYNGSTLNKTGAKGSVTKGAAQNFEEAVTTELQMLEKILEGQKQQTQAIVTPLAALQATMVQCAQLLNQIANQLGNSGGLGNVTGSIASGM